MLYLMIENPGIAPQESFTILGMSTSRMHDNTNIVGKFGTGNKHSVGLCLRKNVSPVVFCGTRKLEFFTKSVNISDEMGVHNFKQVCVKYSGKDENGITKSSTEDLSFVLDYGATDWNNIDMALREFVSNALDHCYKINGTHEQVVIKVVSDNKVRAAKDKTRVFIPLTPEVQNFYNNINKWFLHFQEPEYLQQTVLPKASRNLKEGSNTVVVYRRGVRVREYQLREIHSLFDYNLQHISIDEARNCSDQDIQFYCAQAISNASPHKIAVIIKSSLDNKTYWEHQIPSSYFHNYNEPDVLVKKKENWKRAWDVIVGEDAILCDRQFDQVSRKGFKCKKLQVQNLYETLAHYGIKTEIEVLTEDEKAGRIELPVTEEVQSCFDKVWKIVKNLNLTNKEPPVLKMFDELMQSESQVWGIYRNNEVWIHKNVSGGLLFKAMWEEIAHHVSGATDNSRDFQDFLFRVIQTLTENIV